MVGDLEADVIVKFRIKNLISREELTDFALEEQVRDNSFLSNEQFFDKYVRYVIEQESLFGIVEDDFDVLEIKMVEIK